MTSDDDPKDPWHLHLRESWILIAIFLLIVMVLVWRPFRDDLETSLPPELIGVEGNLQAREIMERLQQEGSGRLYPPRGYGGLSPHRGMTSPIPEASEPVTGVPAIPQASGQ